MALWLWFMSCLLPSWQWFAWQAAPSRGKKGGAKETRHAFRTSNDATSRAAGLSVATWDELSELNKNMCYFHSWDDSILGNMFQLGLKPQSTENWWLSWLLVDHNEHSATLHMAWRAKKVRQMNWSKSSWIGCENSLIIDSLRWKPRYYKSIRNHVRV